MPYVYPNPTSMENQFKQSHKAIILSIPFARLFKSHLQDEFISLFPHENDIIIASPFAASSEIFNKINEKYSHITVPLIDRFSKFKRFLVRLLLMMRMRGYWRKNRKYLVFFWKNRFSSFGEVETPITNIFLKLVLDMIYWIGEKRSIILILDNLIGFIIYRCSELEDVIKKYDSIVIVQSSAWGYQSNLLSWYSKKFNIKNILIPYTTDQLFNVGHLSEFNYVCVQGPSEYRFAESLHCIPRTNILPLGSLQMRAHRVHLNIMEKSMDTQKIILEKKTYKYHIIYAGLSPKCFPQAVEIKALNFLLENLASDTFKIIYRPFGDFGEDILDSVKLLMTHANFEVSILSGYHIQMDKFHGAAAKIIDNEYTIECSKLFNQHTILVTSLTTSLSLDAAFFNTPTIAFYPDDDLSIYEISRINDFMLTLDSKDEIIGFEKIPVAIGLKMLLDIVQSLAVDSNLRKLIANNLLSEWDYFNKDFANIITQISQ